MSGKDTLYDEIQRFQQLTEKVSPTAYVDGARILWAKLGRDSVGGVLVALSLAYAMFVDATFGAVTGLIDAGVSFVGRWLNTVGGIPVEIGVGAWRSATAWIGSIGWIGTPVGVGLGLAFLGIVLWGFDLW